MSSLNQALRAALDHRQDLLAALHQQGTDCYRLFHGSQEGAGGLTVDRYGPQLLVQSFHQALERDDLLALHATVNQQLGLDTLLVYNDRSRGNSRIDREDTVYRADEAALLAEAARQIERVGLSEQIDQPAGSLSLGQQRIVEIARALCADPMLLLLDEPAAGLRHMEKQRLAALLRQLRDGGMSVLLVEHDMGFVMDLADRVVVLDFGTKIAEGTPAAIKSNPEVIKAYLGATA